MRARTDVQLQTPSGVEQTATAPSFLARLTSNPLARWSLMFIVVIIVAALVGPWIYQQIAPPDIQILRTFDAQDFAVSGPTASWPSATHWLGGDDLGRDTLARLLTGLRVSLLVAVVVETINIGLGATLGLLAGHVRRRGRPGGEPPGRYALRVPRAPAGHPGLRHLRRGGARPGRRYGTAVAGVRARWRWSVGR